jgi:hypothetical protein
MTNIVDHPKYRAGREELDQYFIPGNELESKTHVSPSGSFILLVSGYSTKKGCWSYSRGIVTDKEGKTVADIKRNYSVFPFLWVQHKNGNEYLVCGEDYQGYTIINCTHGSVKTFIPEGWLKGCGFCWADYKYDACTNHLIVDGCYWAAPYEIVTYDFSDPDIVPLTELSRKDEEIPIEDDDETPEKE